MDKQQTRQDLTTTPQPRVHGLSRRKALRLLGQGLVGGLFFDTTQGVTPAAAQTIYLPNLAGDAAASPDLGDEECCALPAVLDLDWFRPHLVDEILPKWLAAVTSQGLFLPHFNRQWQPLNRNFGTLVSQGRLLYNFAQGYAVTNDTVYRDAVAAGADFLLTHFRDTQRGGWFWSCNLDGSPRDRYKDSYGHAFVIFGLAHAFRCTGDAALQEAMLQTWEVVKDHFRDRHGGFHRRMTEDFQVTGATKTENPLLHLFEALLAAGIEGGQPQLHQEARTIGNFVFDKLVRPSDRRLPERFDDEWQELPPGDNGSGGLLNIGHAFVWAYLSSYAAELGFPSRFLNYANTFLTYAMALGFDWQEGGIYSPTAPNGVILNQEKGWWEQTEVIRTLLHFYLRHRRKELNGPLQRTLEFVKADFIDPQYGGWYLRRGPGIDPRTLEKGNEWKVDYHVVSMCMEALRLTGQITP